MRKCRNCGKPLPKDAHPNRRHCSDACKIQYHRRMKDPGIDQRAKIPPSNGTGDPELDHILFMNVEATLRNTLLKELLDKRREEGRQEALTKADEWKEERILDPVVAREVARILAKKYDPSRASGG